MIKLNIKAINPFLTVLPFLVILTSIVFVESICHKYLAVELHPFGNSHLVVESVIALIASLIIVSLCGLVHKLSEEVEGNDFKFSPICQDNELFLLLSEKSNDMIHLNDPTGKIIYVNPVTVDLLGYEKDEMINKTADYFIHPDDRETINLDMSQVAQELDVAPREIRLLKKSGEYLDVEVKGFFLNTNDDKKYIGAILRDISKSNQNKALLYAQNEWENTFNSMGDFVSIHDKDLRIVKANRALCEFLGKSPGEIVGKPCYQIFHDMDEPIENCPHKKAAETGHAVAEIIKDPNIGFPVYITCSPLYDSEGKFQGSVHIARSHEENALMSNGEEEITPICAACKSIRSDTNEWVQLEDHFWKKHGIKFTHTVCKDCQEKLYPEYIKP